MISTMTESNVSLDELLARFYGQNFLASLEDVEVAEVPDILSVESLAEKYLSPEINQTFSQVDLKADMLSFVIETKWVQIAFAARGLSLLFIVLTAAALAVGIEPVTYWLLRILGAS